MGLRGGAIVSRGCAAALALFAAFLLLVASASASAPRARLIGPDLVVRSLGNPPASVAPGVALRSGFTIANRGTRRARRSRARAYLSRDSRKGKGDLLLAPASFVPSLKRGKVAGRRSTFKIPSATATGKWFLIVCSDDMRRVRETNERNNCRSSRRPTSLAVSVAPSPTPPPPPPPGDVPPPIAGQGYAVTFQDQFDTLNPNVWTRSVWWDGAHGSDELYAAGGALHLVSRRSRGYPDIDTATYSPASGAPQKRTFRLGYFEARMKIPSGNGSWPAFWLYSKGQADGQTGPNLLNSEIDIADEGEGQRIHFAGVHKNTNSCCGVRDEIGPSENWLHLSYDMSANWHIFSALWTTSEVIFYIDEVEVMRAQAWPSTNQDHLLIIDEWIGGWGSPIDPTTPDVLDLQVDWVRVWQK